MQGREAFDFVKRQQVTGRCVRVGNDDAARLATVIIDVDLEVLAEQPESFEISAEEKLSLLQTLLELDRMLDGLGVKAKTAFLMSQVQGLTYPQIAEHLQVSASSVTKYIARATERCLLYVVENPW